jgi:hypothetical protein
VVRPADHDDAGLIARFLHDFNTEYSEPTPGVEVVTGEDDTAARGLYESFGFRNEIEGEHNSRSLFYELELRG